MEEERQIHDHNGDLTAAITPILITDIIDEMSTSVASVLVETARCDRNILEKENVEEINVCPEEETPRQTSIPETEENIIAEGSETDTNPTSFSQAHNDHNIIQSHNPLPFEDSEPLTQQSEDEALMIREEDEITSFESDKENGEECLSDDQENGPKQSLLAGLGDSNSDLTGEKQVVGNRPDICKHSYSRYDTVSYRKIRKGNTKQRIDEFESMMNL
ncbi:ermin [Spea bombifrons]|uniref:ermin n=1 Tax=Spea bombifrons TaxID=233779 RepID=UPI00234A19DE|nr:ermin [Spea bombifrons]